MSDSFWGTKVRTVTELDCGNQPVNCQDGRALWGPLLVSGSHCQDVRRHSSADPAPDGGAVTASTVGGSLDVHFDNGQVYKNSFDVPVCQVSIDICSLFDFCGSHSCVPP